jgi:hypothetical protein
MDNKKALERIKKCLALSESGNEHEAAAALKKAQLLMQKYGITGDAVKHADFGHTHSDTAIPMAVPTHIAILVNLISEAFGVKPLVNNRVVYGERRIEFYGHKDAAYVASYSFDICARQLSIARREYLKTVHKNCKPSTRVRRADLFCRGWVAAIKENLPTIELDEETKTDIEAYMHSTVGEVTTTERRHSGNGNRRDWKAFSDGQRQGKDFNINRGMTGKATPKLGK